MYYMFLDISGNILLTRIINLRPMKLTTLILNNFQVSYISALVQLLDKCKQIRILTLYCNNEVDYNIVHNCIKMLLHRIYHDLVIEVYHDICLA